jgi:hypothetical protein
LKGTHFEVKQLTTEETELHGRRMSMIATLVDHKEL